MSCEQSVNKYGEDANIAINNELQSMIDNNVFSYPTVIPNNAEIIPSMMFVREKFDSSGNMIKLKARLVAGGHRQDKTIYNDRSSPTITTQSIFLILSLCASRKWRAATLDVDSAYLQCSIGNNNIYMQLSNKLMNKLKLLNNKITCNNSNIVKLERALYGTVVASKLWYNHLKDILIKIGFTMTSKDNCVFCKENCIIGLHVDDILIIGSDNNELIKFKNDVLKYIKSVKFHMDHKLDFLGMEILQYDNFDISINCNNYVKKNLE